MKLKGYADVIRGITAWALLQKVTSKKWTSERLNEPSQIASRAWSDEDIDVSILLKPVVLEDEENSVIEGVVVSNRTRYSNDASSDEKLILDLKRYIRFANGAYGDHAVSFMWSKLPFTSQSSWFHHRNHQSFARHTDTPVDSIFHSSFSTYHSNSIYHPKFYIVMDHQYKQVVFSLRGTLSFHDILIDRKFWSAGLPISIAHSNFY